MLRLYPNTYILLFCVDVSTKPYRGLWFNRTHLPLFPNMSVKIYTNIFFSSGVCNFKINYWKDKMRHGMWVHILLSNLASSPLQREYYFWYRRWKSYEKTVKFYLEITEFKVFVRSNNWNNRLDLALKYLRCYCCDYFLLLLICEYVQQSKWVDTEATNTYPNELIRKQQTPVQSQYGILEAYMIHFIWIIFCWLKWMLKQTLQEIYQ